MLRFSILIIYLLALPVESLAQKKIVAEFSFKKRPPVVGLIYLDEATSSKNLANIDQKDQQFTQRLYVGSSGTVIKLKNSDAIDHNIFANDKDTGVKFDIGLAKPNSELEQKLEWQADKVVKIGCMIHPKMKAYIANINSKVFKIIEFEKKEKTKVVELGGIPQDAKKAKLWMPKYQPIEIDLSSQKSAFDLMRKGKSKGVVKILVK